MKSADFPFYPQPVIFTNGISISITSLPLLIHLTPASTSYSVCIILAARNWRTTGSSKGCFYVCVVTTLSKNKTNFTDIYATVNKKVTKSAFFYITLPKCSSYASAQMP